MKRTIVFAAFVIAAVATVEPVHAQGWGTWTSIEPVRNESGKELFGLMWREYRHSDDLTKVGWKVTNKSHVKPYDLKVSERIYECEN